MGLHPDQEGDDLGGDALGFDVVVELPTVDAGSNHRRNLLASCTLQHHEVIVQRVAWHQVLGDEHREEALQGGIVDEAFSKLGDGGEARSSTSREHLDVVGGLTLEAVLHQSAKQVLLGPEVVENTGV